MWFYRGDGYLGDEGINEGLTLSVMYMDFKELNKIHKEFNEDDYPEIPTLSIEEEYTYNTKEQTVKINGYDSNTMNITNNIKTNAGIYEVTITPKTKWKNGSTTELTINWEIKTANPELKEFKLTGYNNNKLSTVKLPKNWSWKNKNEIIDKSKTNKYLAVYTPEDISNYNIIEKELTINIKEKEEYTDDKRR